MVPDADTKPTSSGPAGWIVRALAVAHFVSPLLFFTNLTQNPCFTQIALLYILLSAVGLLWVANALKTGIVRVPVTGVEKALGLFLAFALSTSIVCWVAHSAFRESILFESIRMWLFTLVNGVWAFYLPSLFIRPLGQESTALSIWPDLGFACVWGLAWFGVQLLGNHHAARPVLDAYSTLLWLVGIGYVLYRTRKCDARAFFHVVFVVSVLAGGYALVQYAGLDPIWGTDAVLPSDRPASTFGNPNFLSSYLLLGCLLALAFALSAKRKEAMGYGTVAVVAGLAITATLTRSTYAGLLAGLLVLAGLAHRRVTGALWLKMGGAALAMIVLILLFPSTHGTVNETPHGRLLELFEALKAGKTYRPWHQRLLTWAAAWDMVKAHPFFGQGWGCFALFHPFYQAAYLSRPYASPIPTRAGNAHNIIMEVWAQVGTVGLVLALLLLATFLAVGVRIVRGHAATRVGSVSAGLLAAAVGMLVDNLLNVSLFIPIPAFLFWWYAGSLFNEKTPREERTWPLRRFGTMVGVLGVGCLCLFSGYYYVARWRQEIAYFAGLRFERASRFAEAIRLFEEGHRWFPRDVTTNYELGNSYVRQGEKLAAAGQAEEARSYSLKAVWAYEEALKANAGYEAIHFNLGVTELELGDEDRGLRALHTALSINPRLERAYRLLAERYTRREAWDEARGVLEQAVRWFPEDDGFLLALSDVEKRRRGLDARSDASKEADR